MQLFKWLTLSVYACVLIYREKLHTRDLTQPGQNLQVPAEVVAFPCFTVVKSFMSWYVLLLSFLFRFSSVSLHWSSIQFSLAFSCTSWCFWSLPYTSLILQVQIFSFSVLSFCCTDQEFLQWPLFFLTMFAKNLTGCFSYCCVEGGDYWVHVCSLFMMVRVANFLPVTAWKVSNILGSFSFSRSNLSLPYFGLLILFRRKREVIISKLWSLPMSAPGKLCVLALFTPDWKHFLTRM